MLDSSWHWHASQEDSHLLQQSLAVPTDAAVPEAALKHDQQFANGQQQLLHKSMLSVLMTSAPAQAPLT